MNVQFIWLESVLFIDASQYEVRHPDHSERVA
jgi:hypothetical protein